tara:strand:- start:1167 stop:1397 length:231 start_codon:yes stop_codon:yes gene_type:complete
MTTKTYMGWTNYETWRVNLEFFDGDDWAGWEPDAMREAVEDMIDDGPPFNLVTSLAMAFIDAVDWNEIWRAYNEEG